MVFSITQGTTPDITFDLRETEITTSLLSSVEMTVADCMSVKITKTTATYHDTYKVTFSLTQAETLALDPGDYRVQLRIRANAGKVMATAPTQMKVIKLASGGVI